MSSARTLMLLTLVGFAVRVPRLLEGLWYDEIAAWAEVGARGARAILTEWPDPVNHVFAVLLAWGSITLFEDGLGVELAMRLPALLASLASVPVLASLGRRAGGERVGMLAAAAAALAPVMVLEGTEARGYAFMMLSTATSTLCAIDGLRGRRRAWLVYPFAAALGVWAHPVTAVVSLGHAAVLGAVAWRQRSRCAGAGLLAVTGAGAIALLLYAPVLDDMLAWRSRAVITNEAQPALASAEGWHALLQLGGAWWWWSALPALVCTIVGLGTLRRSPAARIPVALALAGLPLAVGLVLAGQTWIYARFLLFAVPGALLLQALAIESIWRSRRAFGLAGALIVAAAWGADLLLRPARQPLRGAAEYVRLHRDPDDRVLVIGLRHRVFDLYGSDLNVAHSLAHGADLDDRLAAHDPRWIVVLYESHVGAERIARLHDVGFQEHVRLPGWVDWGGGSILILRRDGAVR